jgi:hypothetical protein
MVWRGRFASAEEALDWLDRYGRRFCPPLMELK